MRLIHDGKVEEVRAVSGRELFKAEPRMDTNGHECKRIATTEKIEDRELRLQIEKSTKA